MPGYPGISIIYLEGEPQKRGICKYAGPLKTNGYTPKNWRVLDVSWFPRFFLASKFENALTESCNFLVNLLIWKSHLQYILYDLLLKFVIFDSHVSLLQDKTLWGRGHGGHVVVSLFVFSDRVPNVQKN